MRIGPSPKDAITRHLTLPYIGVARRNASSAALVRVLLRNRELTEREAKNELRWIRQAVQGGLAPAPSPNRDVGSVNSESRVLELVESRAAGEPLQYVLGTTDFGPLTLLTRPPTLIPRPETAHIVSILADRLAGVSVPLSILDICTGSGCIALLLSHLLPRAILRGVDISPEAVSLAKTNAEYTQLDRNNVRWDTTDIFDSTFGSTSTGSTGTVDVIVSNPPYIPRAEWEALEDSVRAYEDPRALIGDPDDLPGGQPGRSGDGKGLTFYRRIAELAPEMLTPQSQVRARGMGGIPRVAVEIGLGQAQDVERIFLDLSQGAIVRTEVWEDQYGVERMVIGFSE